LYNSTYKDTTLHTPTQIRGTVPSEGVISSSLKIESKDSGWKPAPIMGSQV